MIRRIQFCSLLIWFLVLPATLLATQVKVKVTDHNGQAVVDAETLFVGSQPGEELRALSSEKGEMEFEVNVPGAYKLMIRKAEYLPLVWSGMQVGSDALSVEPKLVTSSALEKWSKDAETAVKKKQHKEAIGLYKQMLVYFPQDAGFWANLAKAYQMDNDMERAMEAIKNAVKYEPTQFQVLEKEIVGLATYEAGKKYLAQREFIKAASSFRESVAADSTYASAFYGLALSYANQGMYPRALEAIQKAIALSPNDAQYKGIEAQLKQAMASSQK